MNAIKIKLSADQLTLPADEPVTIKLTITNTSKKMLPIAGSFEWVVQREGGKSVGDAPEGLRRKEARRAPKTMSVPLYLDAGASSNQEEVISKLYKMNEPGVYLVRMQIGIGDESKTDYVKSNTLRITIQ